MLSFNANTEVFLLLPLMGATLAFTKARQTGDTRWLLLAGLCGGLAALTKQVAVWNLACAGPDGRVAPARPRLAQARAVEQAALAASALLVLAVVIAPWVCAGGAAATSTTRP